MNLLRNTLQSIHTKEWRFAGIIALVLMLLTAIPYLYGLFATPEGYTYFGLHSLTSGDIPVYYSYIEQVKNGSWLLENLYTTEPHWRVLNICWLAVGLFAKLFSLSAPLAFHLTRLLLIPPMVILLFFTASIFFAEEWKRKITLIFFTLSSGFGGLLSPFLQKATEHAERYGYYAWPMDLWVPESNTFLTLFQSPHFIASLFLIILTLLLAFFAFESNAYRYSMVAGLTALILFQFHPFHVPTIALIFGAYLVTKSIKDHAIDWRVFKHSALIGAISLPSILYHFAFLLKDPVTLARATANICLTPSVFFGIISYGGLLVLAIIGIHTLLKTKPINNAWLFLIVWVATQCVLIYAPFDWQRRMTAGLHIPLTILAVAGLYSLPRLMALMRKYTILALFSFLIFFSFSNMYVMANDFVLFRAHHPLLFLKTDTLEAIRFLKTLPKNTVLLGQSLYDIHVLPGFSANRVFLGHGVETVNFETKKAKVTWLFEETTSDEERILWLKEQGITHILFTDSPLSFGQLNPKDKPYLQNIFSNNSASVYRVILSPEMANGLPR